MRTSFAIFEIITEVEEYHPRTGQSLTRRHEYPQLSYVEDFETKESALKEVEILVESPWGGKNKYIIFEVYDR